MGCDGCELWGPKEKTCYAGVLHGRYGGKNPGFSPTFETLTFHPGRMAKAAAWSDLTGKDRPDKPWLSGRPRHIFVSDMSDALSRAVPFDYLKSEIIDNVNSEKGRRHVYMWLTKQAPRMAEFSAWLKAQGIAWPVNLWPGTSVTRQATVSRVASLIRVGDELTTRFVSAEPLLEDIDLTRWVHGGVRPDVDVDIDGGVWPGGREPYSNSCPIRLVIVGGESGGGARPCNVRWIRSIVRQCRAAGVACFVKQMGSRIELPNDQAREWGREGDVLNWETDDVHYQGEEQVARLEDPKGGNPSEWPEDLRVRQFPAAQEQPA